MPSYKWSRDLIFGDTLPYTENMWDRTPSHAPIFIKPAKTSQKNTLRSTTPHHNAVRPRTNSNKGRVESKKATKPAKHHRRALSAPTLSLRTKFRALYSRSSPVKASESNECLLSKEEEHDY